MVKRYRSASYILFLSLIIFISSRVSLYALENKREISKYLTEYAIKLSQQGDIKDAIHEFKKALMADPNNAIARKYLNQLWDKMCKGRKPITPKFSTYNNACENEEIPFDAASTAQDNWGRLTYIWDFGDGSLAEGKTVKHAYKKRGIFTVTLAVDDNEGSPCSTASAKRKIKINSPPAVDAGPDMDICIPYGQELKVNLTASARDPDGDKLNYAWEFGDNTTASGRGVAHSYAKEGEYTAWVKVDDGLNLDCSSSLDSVKVKVNHMPQASAGHDISAALGQEVSFDASQSKFNFAALPTCTWDFGDGSFSATGQKVAHIYTKSGKYKATLTVDDGENTKCSSSADTINVRINSRPQARIEKPKSACVGEKVIFDASASSDPDPDDLKLEYTWDFGDGQAGEGVKTSHIYKTGGIYTVKVTVDDGRKTSASTDTAATNIRINTPPMAGFQAAALGCLGVPIEFDASSSRDPDGDMLTYKWNFGDGSTAEGLKTRHVYTKEGIYKAALTVSDNLATVFDTDIAEKNIKVKKAPTIEYTGKEIKLCKKEKEEYAVSFSLDKAAAKGSEGLRYSIDFGDGTTASGLPQAHAYKKGGIYTVKISADDGSGDNLPCSSAAQLIKVMLNKPPIIKMPKNLACCQGLPAVFDASACIDPDGDILTCKWDFGDGQAGEGVKTSHSYNKSGTYTVKLSVCDNSPGECNTTATTLQVRLNARPQAVIKITNLPE